MRWPPLSSSYPPNWRKRPVVEAEASVGSFDLFQGFDRYQFDGHLSLARRFEDVDVAASLRTYQSDGPDLLGLYPVFAPIRTQPPPLNRFEAPIRSWDAAASLAFKRGVTVGGYFTDHAWSGALGRIPGPAGFAYVPETIWRYQLFEAFARHQATMGSFDFRTIVNYRDLKTPPETADVFVGVVTHEFSQQETLGLESPDGLDDHTALDGHGWRADPHLLGGPNQNRPRA